MEKSPDDYAIRRSARPRKEPQRLQNKDSDKNKKSDDWKYNDASSSESDNELREKPPPSKRVGARLRATAIKKKPVKKSRNKYSSEEETSDDDSDEESRRAVSRRSAATVSYKEDTEEEKTDSEDLLEVDNSEPVETVPEEKCETIEKILAQRRGKKGGEYCT